MGDESITLEEYIQLGALLKEARRLVLKISTKRPIHSYRNKQRSKGLYHLDEARCHLEDLMFVEFPQITTLSIFHGGYPMKVLITYDEDFLKIASEGGADIDKI